MMPTGLITDNFGWPVNDADLKFLAERWITPELAFEAHLRRVDHATGKEVIGQKQAGDYSGLLIPYTWPGENRDREYRLRRDNPEVETRDGKSRPKRKYIAPPGRGNMLYVPPGIDVDLLSESALPIIITEGEFKTLALWRLANHEVSSPRFLPIGLSGVWNWRGTIGKRISPQGVRVSEKGAIPDVSRISWEGRKVIVAFDTDLSGNEAVRIARGALAKELRSRGALTGFLEWPVEWGKGIDDALAYKGPQPILVLLEQTAYQDPKGWRERLITTEKGVPKALIENATIALQESPEWNGVLQFDQFTQTIRAIRPTPWGYTGEWTDAQDIKLACWLQRNSIEVKPDGAHDAVIVAADEHRIDSLKDYLESLEWDGKPRINRWLTDYCGVDCSEYSMTVGAKWLISAVARGLEPGCKVDTCLILEGQQGAGKSRALRTLANGWFTDQLPDLHTKDSQHQLDGRWIIELAELDSLSRSEVSAHKKFLSIQSDRYRPSHGRRVKEFPRRCVFAGSTNTEDWHRDETGGRRFWPVRVGEIDVDALERDRHQLWAEAVRRYKHGYNWWLEGTVADQAAAEISERFQTDAWHTPIVLYLNGRGLTEVGIADLLLGCLNKPKEHWTQADQNRVARVLRSLGWERFNKREGSTVVKRYRLKDVDGVDTLDGFEAESVYS